jgi:phosphoglycerate dehydrogenase-like enzyme
MPEIMVLSKDGDAAPLVTEEAIGILRDAGTVTVVDPASVERLELANVDAAVFAPWGAQGAERFSPRCWESALRLRVIAGTFDNRIEQSLRLSLREVTGRGITVIDTSRSMTPSVAEFALAMILNLLRDIPTHVDLVRAGGWLSRPPEEPPYVSGDLAGRRVGLAGYGVINRTLTRLLSGFGCEVFAYDPYVPDEVLAADNVRRVPTLVELARTVEIFVVGIPPTPTTQKIISAEVIEALPNGSLFVLPTRMAVVDQAPLWRRCAAGELRAAVDVFDPEPPPPDAPFRRDPAVLPTPHLAGNTYTYHRRCFTTACADAAAVLRGETPQYAMTLRDADLYSGGRTT